MSISCRCAALVELLTSSQARTLTEKTRENGRVNCLAIIFEATKVNEFRAPCVKLRAKVHGPGETESTT
jgi:hypothetical protein